MSTGAENYKCKYNQSLETDTPSFLIFLSTIVVRKQKINYLSLPIVMKKNKYKRRFTSFFFL